MRDWITRGLLAFGVLGAIGIAGARLPYRPPATSGEAYVIDPQVASVVALGFETVLGDLHWMRAVQIVGSDEGPAGRSGLIGALLEVVTTLDPWVDHPYRFAAVWMHDDEPAVRKANELLRRGIAHHPDDWRNYFYLAFNHFFYLDEPREAAAALEPALGLEGAPTYLNRLLARLKSSQAGGLDAAEAFLIELANQAPSEDERAEYLRAIDEIETERRARYLDAARAAFVQSFERDIARVEELVESGILRELPPEPHGKEWQLDPSSGQIVSSHVRFRYRAKIDGTSQKIIDEFRERSRKGRAKG